MTKIDKFLDFVKRYKETGSNIFLQPSVESLMAAFEKLSEPEAAPVDDEVPASVRAFRGLHNGFDYLLVDGKEVGFRSKDGVWRVSRMPRNQSAYEAAPNDWDELPHVGACLLHGDWKKKTV